MVLQKKNWRKEIDAMATEWNHEICTVTGKNNISRRSCVIWVILFRRKRITLIIYCEAINNLG